MKKDIKWWNTNCGETSIVLKEKLWWNTNRNEKHTVIILKLWWNQKDYKIQIGLKIIIKKYGTQIVKNINCDVT